MSLFSILLFIIILLVLVFVHEFGHFFTAKLAKMRVDEFALGFPPKIFSKTIGETKYSINIIPFGGFVSIFGENFADNEVGERDKRAFNNRPYLHQLIVLLAGIFMNFLLALVIFIFLFYGNVDASKSDPAFASRVIGGRVMIIDSSKGSPAFMAGLLPGAVIEQIKSGNEVAKLDSETDVITFIQKNIDKPISISFTNIYNQKITTVISGVYGIVPDKKALGISVDVIGKVKVGFFEAVKIGSVKTYDITVETLAGLKSLIISVAHRQNVIDSLAGPIGIAKIVGATSMYGYQAVLNLVAVLSINLAILNLLPIPALDGGRAIVVLFESIFKKKVPYKILSIVNTVSFLLLILLLVAVSIKDVYR